MSSKRLLKENNRLSSQGIYTEVHSEDTKSIQRQLCKDLIIQSTYLNSLLGKISKI